MKNFIKKHISGIIMVSIFGVIYFGSIAYAVSLKSEVELQKEAQVELRAEWQEIQNQIEEIEAMKQELINKKLDLEPKIREVENKLLGK